MDNQKKPRLAEVLGVEVGERFFTPQFPHWLYVSDDGDLVWDENDNICFDGKLLQYIINYPESIERTPRLTENEMALCRASKAKYLARDQNSYEVILYEEKPVEVANGNYGNARCLGSLTYRLFPSVWPGCCICVEEADGK